MNNNKDIDERDRFSRKINFSARIELNFWKSCVIIALGILIANLICTDYIHFGDIFSYAGLVVVIWALNAILRPFLVLITLPFIILTFGVGMVFINALVIWIASGIIPKVSFTSYAYALLTSFIIEVISWAVSFFEREKTRRKEKKNKDEDLIDV